MFTGVTSCAMLTAADLERFSPPGKQVEQRPRAVGGPRATWHGAIAATRVYRDDGSLSVLRENDALEGETVLPGFTCPVKHVFS